MKVICLQENLKNALSLAERMIGKNLSLPILSNILLKTEKGFLKISSTNLEIGLNIMVAAKIEKEGEASIKAKIFSDYISNLPNNKIFIEEKDSKVSIKCEGFKAVFLGSSPKDFPIIPAIKDKSKFIELQAEILRDAINKVINAVSVSDNRIELTGILFSFSKQNIKVVATDSFRLTEKTIKEVIVNKLTSENKKENNFIIPQKTAQELLRILENKIKVKIYLNEGQAFFETEDIYLVSRIIEGEYPDYEQIIPKSFKTKIHLDKTLFANAIKLSSLFSSKINDIKIKTNKKTNTLEVFSKDFELGETKSEVPIKMEGNDMETAFNYKYLSDGLSNISENEIILELNDENQPGFLKGKKDNDYFYIAMPLKIH